MAPRSNTHGTVAALALLLALCPSIPALEAQERAGATLRAPAAAADSIDFRSMPDPAAKVPSRPARFGQMAVAAIGGSALGAATGLYVGAGPFYRATGCCGGGDDPGLESGLVGGLLGSIAGSVTGAVLAGAGEAPLGNALVGSVAGVLPGILLARAGGYVGQTPGLVIGFSIGQGATTAAFSTLLR